MRAVEIGNRKVGEGQPCFIIAEVGSNHNGDLDLALRLIDVAAQAGADRSYRSREEEEEWAQRDPLLIQGARLEKVARAEIAQQCQKLVEEAVSQALKAGFPPAPSLLE